MAKRSVYEFWKKTHNQFSGTRTESNFQQTGTLTAKEFIEAGDALCQKIPVWEWASGSPDVQPYLPPEKKYLVFRGATCFERADNPEMDALAGQGVEEDDWVATHPGYKPKPKAQAQEKKEINWDDDDEEVIDDDDKAQTRPCRLYDVYVVWDKYYQTPRVFLQGYENGKALSKEEMMQDVYAENREKTVSIDPHPYLDAPCISIHPCRHSETMRAILEHQRERLEAAQEGIPESQKVPFIFPTYMALFAFLKFISSVVPTIQYDLAVDMEL